MDNRSLHSLMVYLFFAYSTMTIIASYLPVFYQSQGLTGAQVGMLMAIGPFATILAQPLWGYWSDKYKSIRRMLLIALVGFIMSATVFMFVNAFAGYFVMMFILFIFLSPITALGDSLSQKTAIKYRISFGRIRMWGSLGFAVTSLITGYILTWVGVENIMLPVLFMAVIALLVAFAIYDVPGVNKPVTVLSALKLGANPNLILFLICVTLISVTHRANDTYLGIYIVELGGPEAMIGWAWFIGVTAEALVFATSYRWFKNWSPLTFVMIAALIYAGRWFLMGLLTNPWLILPLQLTHGLSFGLFYIASFHYVSKLVPEHLQATGHVLFITTFFGLSGIIGSLFGGYMIETAHLSTLYAVLGICALVGAISLMIYKRFVHHNSEMFL